MRTLSTAITAEIAKEGTTPRTLYYIEIKDKSTGVISILRLTNHDSDLTFQGNTYTSYRITHSSIKTHMKNQTDNCNVTIDNVDKAMSAYFASSDFSGQKAEIYKVFLDSSGTIIDGHPTTDDKILQFTGFMDKPRVSEMDIKVRIVNAFDRSRSFTPWRRLAAKCNWDFCGEACGYNSGNGKPRGTATSGTITTLTDTALGVFTDGYWIRGTMKILSGTNRGAQRKVSAYDGTLKKFTVEAPFSAAIDSTSRYIIECDKFFLTCGQGFSNFVRFSGYNSYSKKSLANRRAGGSYDTTLSMSYRSRYSPSGDALSIIYGEGEIQGTLLAKAVELPTAESSKQWTMVSALYGICEGEIDEITGCTVNGSAIDLADTYGFEGRLGDETNNSIGPSDFPTVPFGWVFLSREFRYFRTAFAAVNSGNAGNLYGFPDNKLDADPQSSNVVFTVKGLKLQEYDSGGSPTVKQWSNNPAWCILNFLEEKASKVLDSSLIDYVSFYNAAQVCTANDYKMNLVISEQANDLEIITHMLTSCGGYLTYTAGKATLNIEDVWSHPVLANKLPVHIFDDASNPTWQSNTIVELGDTVVPTVSNGYAYKCTIAGTTNDTEGEPTWPTTVGQTVTETDGVKWECILTDNIKEGSFEYFEHDVNETPNRFIVKYIDHEIRQTMALITSSYIEGVLTTSIEYGDLQGTLEDATDTVYIGAEAITYTAKTATTLTVNWTPQKTYSKGYPLFQGIQSFPEETAIYNDYDHQDKVDRIIDKQIDGRAIATYRQAANIAEKEGRKAIEGNLHCSLTGLMDSLILTVGDVVKVTHNLPGWVDLEFRINEASESENEEVSYIFELYDDAFYAINDIIPEVSVFTTLPKPFVTPDDATNLSLSEDGYFNNDGAYVPTLTLIYDLPQDNIFWDKALIQISTDGGSSYVDYGEDTSRGTGFTIDATQGRFQVGQTVTARVVSISTNNIYADASTAPIISNLIDGQAVDPATPSGLQLEGASDPMNYTWDGLRFAIKWRGASQTGGAGREPAGRELQGAGGVGVDPYWLYDEVEIWISDSLQHSFTTRELRYEYIYGDGYEDFLDSLVITANGTVALKVRRWNQFNRVSDYIEITISQAAPANPTGLTSDFNGRDLVLSWTEATETDFNYHSLTLGSKEIKLTDAQYAYALDENIQDNGSADPSITYALKTYDIYNNASGSVTGTFTNPTPTTPTGLASSQWMDSVQFSWAKSTDADLSHYEYRYKIDAGAFGSWIETHSNEVLITAEADEVITIEVKTVDLFGQESSADTANGTAQGLNVEPTDINDFAITASKIFTKIPILDADSWTDDSPSANYVTWNAHKLYYDGAEYSITGGNTDKKYIYWTGGTTYSTSDTNPILSDGQFIISTNISGSHDLAWNAIANQVIGSAYIQELAVQTAHIEDLAVNNAKINDLAVDKLTAGTITSQVITLAITEATGDVAIQAGKTAFGDSTAGFILGIDDSDSNKAKFEIGDATNYLSWDGSVLNIRGALNADDIQAGTLKSLKYHTKGSYNPSSISAAQSTLALQDVSDFPTSGSGWVLGTTNDRDAFSWTGKSGDQLTGCSGLLVNPTNSTVIPALKNILMDEALSEQRFYGNRGDGAIEELVSIGIRTEGPDNIIGYFGTANSTRIALRALSGSARAISALSISNDGIVGSTSSSSNHGVVGQTTGAGTSGGVKGLGNGAGTVGVYGDNTSGTGVLGQSTSSFGVYGLSTSSRGVGGKSTDNYGVYGESTNSIGVVGKGNPGLVGDGNISLRAIGGGIIELLSQSSTPGTSGTYGRLATKNGALIYVGTSGTATTLAPA
jgi:hypothetical protein